MSSETVAELAQHPNIIGIKEASCIIEQCMEINRDCPDDFLLISGDDIQSLAIMSCGGIGTMSVIGNAFPKEFGEVIHAALNNDYATARKLLVKFIRIDPLLYEEGNPVGVKKILEAKGIINSFVRPPLYPASDELGIRQIETLKLDGLM
jgi:4-hydroxy-tetrahydrodipicolinate synthase